MMDDRTTTLCLRILAGAMACSALACSDDIPPIPPSMTTTDDDPTGVSGVTLPTATGTPTTDMTATGSGSGSTTGTDPSDGSDTTDTTSTTDPPTTSTTTGGVCGDGEVQSGEDCDGANLAGLDCEGLGLGFSGGTLACAPDCTLDTSACWECGNDLIEGDEQCDSTELGGSDCESEGFLGGTLTCGSDCSFSTSGCVANLYFSEYAEGSSNNKAVEIYNASSADADLASCEVRFYFAPNVVPGNTIGLAGTLAADDTLVICDDDIDPMIFSPVGCDILAPGSFFNGDDSIELDCGGTVLDVIGQIGTDPGAEWLVGSVGTQDETLRRDCSVLSGDTNGADPFDPSAEWASFPQNDFGDFGQYDCP